jgi:hypothetical protein
MTDWLPILVFLVFWAVSMRALLVRAELVRPLCAHCGRPSESRYPGEKICACARR